MPRPEACPVLRPLNGIWYKVSNGLEAAISRNATEWSLTLYRDSLLNPQYPNLGTF